MATSGTTLFSITRDALITHAYRVLGSIRTGGVASPDEITDATQSLNMMIKAWMAYGLQLWVVRKASIVPIKSAQRYRLGPDGDHVSSALFNTTLRVAGITTDATLDVLSTEDMAVADNIGINLDDGTTQWTTILTIIDANTVTIAAGLVSPAAVMRKVYWYTAKIDRPNELLEVYRREVDTEVDVPLIRLSRTDFYTLSDKDTEGTPVNFYYDPQLNDSVIHVWPTANAIFASNSTIDILIKKPFDDMVAPTDDFEFPQEWYEAIVYGLAERIAPMIGYPIQDRQLLKMEAREYLDLALTFGGEHTSVTFVSDENQRSR